MHPAGSHALILREPPRACGMQHAANQPYLPLLVPMARAWLLQIARQYQAIDYRICRAAQDWPLCALAAPPKRKGEQGNVSYMRVCGGGMPWDKAPARAGAGRPQRSVFATR